MEVRSWEEGRREQKKKEEEGREIRGSYREGGIGGVAKKEEGRRGEGQEEMNERRGNDRR